MPNIPQPDIQAKLKKYICNAKSLFENLKVLKPEGAKLHEMAMAYYRDANHFYDKGEYINGLAALEYGEGWMDAGIELGLLDTVERD